MQLLSVYGPDSNSFSGAGGQIMAHVQMKDKTNVGFSVHTCVMEICHVQCTKNNTIIKHLKQTY